MTQVQNKDGDSMHGWVTTRISLIGVVLVACQLMRKNATRWQSEIIYCATECDVRSYMHGTEDVW